MPDGGLRVGVLASGRGSNLKAILDASESKKIDASVKVVISNKSASRALELARENGVPAVHLDPKGFADRAAYDAETARVLNQYEVELVVLAGYMRIVGKALIEPFEDRIINIHPSLLPAFPGMAAQEQALEWGARISGCTVHMVDETLDQGVILIQAAVPVLEGDTPGDLESRILAQEHRILPQAIQFFAERRVTRKGRRVILENSKMDFRSPLISPNLEAG
ncbi:MAG TPA: phosphoribosylglycinamide formyltransferase [Nitrospiria bacterium]|nr:phosphoribosylglycinamide formyltransferase [Nitrospiria bacterium]